MNLLFWKVKLAAAGAVLLTVLAAFIRHRAVIGQRDRAVAKHKHQKARADQAIAVGRADNELDQEFSDLKREAAKDIESGDVPKNLSDSNNF